jgi:hypothetical protein
VSTETHDDEYRWHTGKQRPTGTKDAVEFIDVHKAFGRNKILRGLNMTIPEDKISMILGPSGTGKSVCIKHMVGLLYPDEGDVMVHGESVPGMRDDDLFDMRKRFGVLFQDGALFGSMNLYDNVAFPLRQHTDKGEDEIDALEVMGISSMTFLCATRLLAAWLVLPFMYLAGIGAGFFASYLAVVEQIGEVSSGGYSLIFWMFQNPPDLLYSVIKAMAMATVIVLVGCYYGYTASGGPVGVGTATAKSMVLNIVMVHLIGMMGTQIFWGANPRAPIGG